MARQMRMPRVSTCQRSNRASTTASWSRRIDATIIESVDLRHAQTPIIPLKAIETLGQALKAGTAFFEEGTIVCMTTGALWKQIIRRGGLLLDATPSLRQVKEVEVVGGTVATVRVEQPQLKVVQYGLRLHGRGGLAAGGAERWALALERGRGGAVAITQKPVASLIENTGIRHWGAHKAHNDWKNEDRLVLHGLPLLSPRDQRASSKRPTVPHWQRLEWSGPVGTGRQKPGRWSRSTAGAFAAVPAYPPSRTPGPGCWTDWPRTWPRPSGGYELCAGASRSRSRFTDYLLPLVGHGIRIDEFRHEHEGRAADNIKTRAAVAAGVIHMDEHTTRRALSDFVLRQSGRRASNTTLDCILDEIKAAALTRGITLAQAWAALLATAERLLDVHGGDAVAALQEVAGKAPATELLLWACAHEPLADGPRAAQGP